MNTEEEHAAASREEKEETMTNYFCFRLPDSTLPVHVSLSETKNILGR